MGFYESVRAVTTASGDGPIDWAAAGRAAKGSTDPGSLALSPAEEEGYATDVADARERITAVTGVEFAVPDTVQVLNRHHWLDANVDTFERVMRPLESQVGLVPELSRLVNTGSMAVALSFLARNVLGQYDPLLLADAPREDHALYFVHPNIVRVADALGVENDRFRRWIAFHELTHAAEFAAAPWLSDHLESRVEEAIEALTDGRVDRVTLGELDTTMTAVEGYAELVMDRAFDDEYADLRRKLDARRRNRGPVAQLIGRLLGLGMKRRQYERGKEFFEAIADARGLAGASVVWDDPANLPTDAELDQPGRWLGRIEA
jgi:uncharacterized protein (DUF2342 family)